MKGPILVSLKTLCKLYPLYTKSGSIWKNRVDWTKIEIPGMIIVTQFGIFTFVKAERINKIWYWTLQTMDGSLYTIKRDQARKNKRMPKKVMRIVKIWKNVINKSKEVIDRLIEEANDFAEEKNKRAKNFLETTSTYKDFVKSVSDIYNVFEMKIHYIYAISKQIGNTKQIYKILANAYHPDKTKQNTHDEFTYIKSVFKCENLIN